MAPISFGVIDNRSVQRRREHRYEVWESVVLSPVGVPGGGHSATIVDISRSGYRVLSGIPLAPGTEILTTLHSVAIFGIVRHCEEASDGFTTGVEIRRVVAAAEASPDLPACASSSPSDISAS